jgi:amino acid adenylation domain-containing protein
MHDEKAVTRQPLASVFEDVAAARDGHPALLCEGRRMTYGALNRRANRFARVLRARGAESGDLVAVSLDRSFDTFVVLLGILKAGCAYVPLDPKLPPARRMAIANDCGTKFLAVTERELVLDEFRGEILATWAMTSELAACSDEPLDVPHAADDIACVLYTSGSTGRPKGVIVSGRAILNHALWMWATYPFGDDDAALLHRSYMHMAATWDYFGPLLGGIANVIVPGHQTSDPAVVIRAAVEHGVSHVSGSPGFWRAVLDQPAALLQKWQTLRVGTTSGEQLPVRVVADWQRVFPEARLLNVYGITEAVRPAVFDTGALEADAARVPIGQPLPNVAVYIVDEALVPVADGEIGEICVAGACLARGYFGLPQLTEERFLANPFDDGWPVLFRTGDVGRLRADGSLEIVGRRDHQVKVRGFRVELEDVEAALQQSPATRRAVVVAQEDHGGDLRLIAYVVPAAGANPTWLELRAFLEARLPDHMIPASFVVTPEIPLTPSGKVDRVALAALEVPAASRGRETASEAERSGIERTTTELQLAQIWSDVIGVADVAGGETFIELGGHSLMAMQIASRVYDAFGVELPLETFFPNPTLRAMSGVIDELRTGVDTPAGV